MSRTQKFADAFIKGLVQGLMLVLIFWLFDLEVIIKWH